MHGTRYPEAVLLIAAAALLSGCERSAGTTTSAAVQAMDVPAVPGSQSPNLAGGPDGVLALSWLAPDESSHRLQYAVLEETTWSSPNDVARGENWFVNWADFPSVVPVSESLWAAHWLVRQPAGGYAYDVFLSVSRDGGTTWSDPVIPHDDGTPTEHGFVTIFPETSGIGLIWLDGRNMAQGASHHPSPQGMTLRSASYSSVAQVMKQNLMDERVCDCCQTDVAMTARGAVAVYRDRTAGETRDIYAARHADGAWQRGHPVADDGWIIGGCPVNGPVIGADANQVAVAWFTAAHDEPKVRLARSTDSGEHFSAPLDVTDSKTFGRAGLAMLGNGNVAVSWLCKESANRARVCLRQVTADDRLGPVHIVSGDEVVPPLSVPQLARSGDFLIAAWTVRDGDGTGIRSSRIAIDSLL